MNHVDEPTKNGQIGLDRDNLPFIAADSIGIVTEINDHFSTEFGWSPDALVGRPLTLIIPERLRDAHHIGFCRFLATQVSKLLGRTVRLGTICADGREVLAEHRIVASQEDGQWIFRATIRPVPDDERERGE